MDAGVIPVKRVAGAKSRLGSELSDEQRSRLVGALLEDVLDVCASVTAVDWFVVGSDDEVRALVEARDMRWIADPGGGLNPALAAAVSLLSAEGAESVLVMPSDVPLVRNNDLHDVLDTAATSEMVVVPAARGGGTNALYLNPPDLIAPRFGDASLAAHVKEAERLRIRCAILSLPRLSLDIDTSGDIDTLLERDPQLTTRTARLLETWRR